MRGTQPMRAGRWRGPGVALAAALGLMLGLSGSAAAQERKPRIFTFEGYTSASAGLDYADQLTWLRPAADFAKRTGIWNEVKAMPVQ